MAEEPQKHPLDDLDNDNIDNITNGENDNMDLNESMSVDDWLDEAVSVVSKSLDDNSSLSKKAPVCIPDLLPEDQSDAPADEDDEGVGANALEMMMQPSSSGEEKSDLDGESREKNIDKCETQELKMEVVQEDLECDEEERVNADKNKVKDEEIQEEGELRENVGTAPKSLEKTNNVNEEVAPPQTQQQNMSPPQQDRGATLMNRFSNWRSKADAAIQNNHVLKMAQKNIEEKRKEVQKAVEQNILNKSIATNFNGGNEKASQNAVDQNDIEEDDLSYASGRRSILSEDEESQGSSVYVNSDDASYSSYSDTSSVHMKSSRKERKRSGSLAESMSSTTSSSHSRSRSSTPKKWTPKPQTLFSGDLNDDNDATPLKKNTNGIDMAPDYKGRYEPTWKSKNRNRENVLKQLQRRMRAPSPPPLASPPKIQVERHESQTALLQKSMPGPKIKELLGALPSGHYLMLLKPGMLGVNLKQTYLSGNGVYVDFLIPGGNAKKSGVVCVGDGLVKVSNVDVSKGKIYDVPGIIAESRRPAILIFNGEHGMKFEEMDYLAVAIGAINQLLADKNKGLSRSLLDDVEIVSGDSIVPKAPSKSLRLQVESYAKLRNNQSASFSLVLAACQQDQNLRRVLRQAFRICTIDNRRLPFFAAFLSHEDAFNSKDEEFSDLPVAISASTRLMLYLELISYRDLFSVASPKRRLDHAELISSKFLLRRGSSQPLFDLRPMFPADVLSALQESEKTVNAETIDLDYFKEVESCIEDSLAGAKFASFLLSDECARMRAYMRGTAPYIDPQLAEIICDQSNICSKEYCTARNHMKFILVYLLCQKENDALDKNFEMKDGKIATESKRLQGSAAGFSCAIFISRTLIPSIVAAKKGITEGCTESESLAAFKSLISAVETFWETYIAPQGGLLECSSYSNDTNDLVGKVRQKMLDAVNEVEECSDCERLPQLVKAFVQNEDFEMYLPKLRDELIYDYYVNHHAKYRAHMIHEWMCCESNSALHDNTISDEAKDYRERVDITPRLREGVISRLIRKLEIPESVSRHCPVHKPQNQIIKEKVAESVECNFNADYSLVFTKSQYDSQNEEAKQQMKNLGQSSLQNAVCVPLHDSAKLQMKNKTIEEVLPVTIASYAMLPPLKYRSFGEPIYYGRTIPNGWEVTLVNFMAPKATNESDDFWYGVSLVLNHVIERNGSREVHDVVTLTLISERNVIPAMRSSLVKLYEEKVISKPHDRDCNVLVNALKNLHTKEERSQILSSMLEPYIKIGSSPWLDQPLISQEKAFERSCMEVLVETLSPIPLALLLVTALLEQKIVFTSGRRSALISMISGLRSLLHPLGWSHLIVPTAPSSLAGDLVQYPAPFIMGIPLDNNENMKLLKRLPNDITLVDIDVGRVILTQQFSHHFRSGPNGDDKDSSAALRSQVMHLAENLGNVIGAYQSGSVWRSDSPLQDSFVSVNSSTKVEAVTKIANSFVRELTAGVNSCCYWVEEEFNGVVDNEAEQDILFDEDRFFHLKHLRSEGLYFSMFKGEDLATAGHYSPLEPRPILALNMNDYNLVISTFIRGQAMSSFISSQKKQTMPFW